MAQTIYAIAGSTSFASQIKKRHIYDASQFFLFKSG
jgi:hypothetical protein